MGADTKIQWTDSTINVWHGCTKVDALCKHCYAEFQTPVRVKRAKGLELWGPQAARSETKDWRQTIRRLNAAAAASGKVHRVFMQSLSDTFEEDANQTVIMADGRRSGSLRELRAELFAAIEAAPALTFQTLTKRPENVKRMVPPKWLVTGAPEGSSLGWPAHVWIGASVGDREGLSRIEHLRRIPARTRFVSFEPLLEDLGDVDLTGIAWAIIGGESGHKARPCDLAWIRSLRDQARAAGVACFVKQLGSRWAIDAAEVQRACRIDRNAKLDSHGGNPDEWMPDLRVREFPEVRP